MSEKPEDYECSNQEGLVDGYLDKAIERVPRKTDRFVKVDEIAFEFSIIAHETDDMNSKERVLKKLIRALVELIEGGKK